MAIADAMNGIAKDSISGGLTSAKKLVMCDEKPCGTGFASLEAFTKLNGATISPAKCAHARWKKALK